MKMELKGDFNDLEENAVRGDTEKMKLLRNIFVIN